MTPYEKHKLLNHKTTFFSPDGFVKIEECSECGVRYLHSPLMEWPVTLSPLNTANE